MVVRTLVLVFVPVCCLAQVGLPVEFDAGPGWEACPTFLGNAASTFGLEQADGVATLRVSEPGKGMKFELKLRPFDSETAPYLLVRYRASALAGGYALWAYDEEPGGRQVLGVAELLQDGDWHVAAVDLWEAGAKGCVRSVLTEVQCRREPAVLRIDYLRLSEELPAGASVHPATRKKPTEVVLRPAELAGMQPQPDWLALDADAYRAEAEDGVLHLSAEGAGKGMKWSVPLAEPLDLTPFRYAAVRYRARDVQPHGDYFIWLGNEPGGKPPESNSLLRLTQLRSDDTWRVKVVPVTEAFTAVELAVQVMSSGEQGDIWLDSIRFTSRRPLLDVEAVLPVERGWSDSRLPADGFRCVDLSTQANARAAGRLRSLGLRSWFPAGRVRVRGVPFLPVSGGDDVVVTPNEIDEEARVTIGAAATELYLLLGSRLPRFDAARMGDPVPMDGLSSPQRFVLGVQYEDDVVDEIMPVCLATGRHEIVRGTDVYCLTGLRSTPIRRVVLRNRMESASFVLAALTLNTGAPVTVEPTVAGLPDAVAAREEEPGAARVSTAEGICVVENNMLRLELRVDEGVRLHSLTNRCLLGGEMSVRPGPLFEIGDGQTTLTSEQVAVGVPTVEREGGVARLIVSVDGTRGGVPLSGQLVVTAGEGAGIGLELDLINAGDAPVSPTVVFPTVEGIRMGSVPGTWYLYARKGGIVSNASVRLRQAYGGEYPLQVADVFSPDLGGGLALYTCDREGMYRFWRLNKDESGVGLGIESWRRQYLPGERIEIAPAALQAHTGDWRHALAIYRDWAHSWYHPAVPRKPWFQRVFYYQQTTAWGRLRDPATGVWRMAEEVRRYRDALGCLDYLHIFDFGQSRIYGRVGDYCHYDELGGLAGMREAVRCAQDMGVPVGLYIEGYLCDERGMWGRDHVPACDIRKKNGEPLLWPGAPSEHMMCPAARTWRSHLADTYRRVAGELKPNGMYIDQYGFTNTWKTCWSREHGHPIPWAPLRGERDTTAAIRSALPAEVANLTEETPCDVVSQYQDGALGYSVTQAKDNLAPHRIDLFRFVFPTFKVFQLVQYNPFTEGGWELLKYPFFNGEGYWLGGATDERTYCADARGFLRRAFAILNAYEEAFCSTEVSPLIPTLNPRVYANEFRGPRHTVWTLFNAEYRTVRGDCLRVGVPGGSVFHDAFTREPIEVRAQGPDTVVPCVLGPREVGCVVAERPRGGT